MWFERQFTFKLGPHLLRGRVDRVDRLPGGEYELIDYKTGRPKSAAQLADDVQLSLYAVGAREAWELDASRQAYYYLLDDQKVSRAPDDGERAEWITRGRRSRSPRGSSRRASSRRRRSRRARSATTGSSARRPSARAAQIGAGPEPRGRGPGLVVAALAQEALQIAGDRLAGGERPGLLVGLLAGRLLEALDERLHVGVALHREADLALVVGGRRLELGGVDRDADEPLELAHERERRLGVRGRGDVVRDRRPQAGRRQPRLLAGGVEHADDPGRPLVGGGRQPEPRDERGIGGQTGDRDRPRVGNVGEQRAERHHQLDADRLGDLDDHLA